MNFYKNYCNFCNSNDLKYERKNFWWANISEKEKKREIRENLKIYLKIVVFNGYFMFFENIKILLLIFAIIKT